MGKGAKYRKGHSPEKQRANYEQIDWSKKPKRVYHSSLGQYGDIINESKGWITVRMDGKKSVCSYEADAPYIIRK